MLIDELGTAFEGNEQALRRILDASDALLAEATADLPQTVGADPRRPDRAATQAGVGRRRSAAGRTGWPSWPPPSAPPDPTCAGCSPPGRRPRPSWSACCATWIPPIGTLLGNLVTVNGIAARRLPGIEQLLVVYPIAVAGGFTVTPGRRHRPLRPGGQRQRPAGLRLPRRRPAAPPRTRPAGRAYAAPTTRPGPAARAAAPLPAGPVAAGPAARSPGSTRPPAWCSGRTARRCSSAAPAASTSSPGDQSWKQLLLAGLTP